MGVTSTTLLNKSKQWVRTMALEKINRKQRVSVMDHVSDDSVSSVSWTSTVVVTDMSYQGARSHTHTQHEKEGNNNTLL